MRRSWAQDRVEQSGYCVPAKKQVSHLWVQLLPFNISIRKPLFLCHQQKTLEAAADVLKCTVQCQNQFSLFSSWCFCYLLLFTLEKCDLFLLITNKASFEMNSVTYLWFCFHEGKTFKKLLILFLCMKNIFKMCVLTF